MRIIYCMETFYYNEIIKQSSFFYIACFIQEDILLMKQSLIIKRYKMGNTLRNYSMPFFLDYHKMNIISKLQISYKWIIFPLDFCLVKNIFKINNPLLCFNTINQRKILDKLWKIRFLIECSILRLMKL